MSYSEYISQDEFLRDDGCIECRGFKPRGADGICRDCREWMKAEEKEEV
jgi:hypothetical protein